MSKNPGHALAQPQSAPPATTGAREAPAHGGQAVRYPELAERAACFVMACALMLRGGTRF